MAHSSHSELTAGLMHAEHDLQVDSPQFGTYTVQDDPSQQVLLGLKADLSELTELGQPMYLGVMIGSEKFGDELLAFHSGTNADGQYFNYGRQPLFLSIGVGTNVWRGLSVGVSTKVTLKSEASLVAQTDLAGNTQYEQLDVSAKPVIRPILSVNFDWDESFCPDASCWYDGLQTAFAFKGYSDCQRQHRDSRHRGVNPGHIWTPPLLQAVLARFTRAGPVKVLFILFTTLASRRRKRQC